MCLFWVKPKALVLEPGELSVYQQATEPVFFELVTEGVEGASSLADDRGAKESLAAGIGGEDLPGNLFRPLGIDYF